MGLIDEVARLQKEIDTKKQEANVTSVNIKGYEVRAETDQAKAEAIKLADIYKEIDKLTAQLDAKQSKIHDLQQQVTKLEKDMNDSQQLLNATRHREGLIHSELEHMRVNIRTLQSELGGGGGFF